MLPLIRGETNEHKNTRVVLDGWCPARCANVVPAGEAEARPARPHSYEGPSC